MSRYQQQSFIAPTPTINGVRLFTIEAHDFIRPKELMSAVNQREKIKIHCLTDTSTPIRPRQFMLVGTGDWIPEEMIDRIYHVASLTLEDGKFGYHLYGVDEGLVKDKKAFKKLEVLFDDNGDSDEIEEVKGRIMDVIFDNSSNIQIESMTNTNAVALLYDQEDEFDWSSEFRDLRDMLEDSPAVVSVSIRKLA
ncbi:hypothetical protein ACI2KR_07855 [Pseudomonas luteola]